MNVFAGGKGVADNKITGIGHTDNITRVSFFDDFFLGSHKSGRTRDPHIFARADVFVYVVSFEPAGANFYESDPAAMVRVDVGVNFKNEPGKAFFLGFNFPFFGKTWSRAWCNFNKGIQ